MRQRLAYAAGLCLAATGCTDFASGDDTRAVLSLGEAGMGSLPDGDDDEIEGSSETENSGDWSCLDDGSGDIEMVTLDDARQLTYSIGFTSVLGQNLSAVSVRACSPADVNCLTPLTVDLTPDTQGFVRVPLSYGFAGFLEIVSEGYLPEVAFLREPLQTDEAYGGRVALVPPEAVAPLAMASGVDVRRELAIIAVIATDCAGQRAKGVRYSTNIGGLPFYYSDGIPTPAATATDLAGTGGFLNVPPGLVSVNGITADGHSLPSRRGLVRGRGVTLFQLGPSLYR